MKILIIHNFHRSGAPSGDDIVVKQEIQLLKSYGHEVVLFSKNNDDFEKLNFIKKIDTFLHLDYSQNVYKELISLIKSEKFDIAHIHNIFPLITPSVYFALKASGIPIVHTLHDFRFFCANAFLFRNGKFCELCPLKSPIYSVIHRCFKNSLVGSFFVYAYLKKVKSRSYYKLADKYICLTEFSRQLYEKYGIPDKKLKVKPNFCEDLFKNTKSQQKEDYFIYVGRLSEEKGIRTLIEAFSLEKMRNVKLKIYGSGPLEDEIMSTVKIKKLSNIEFLGFRPRDEVVKTMSSAVALVFPSICLESFPMTIIESFSAGTPVVASDFGNMKNLVKQNHTGLLFERGNPEDLAEKILYLYNNRELAYEMGENAREEYLQKFTPEVNYNILMQIYEEAIRESK
jgi:glycosyltransferase involved in cell wall biosynthesis